MRASIGRDDPLVVGTEESRRAAREQARQQQRLRVAQRAGWPEIPRTELRPWGPFLEREPTGDLYQVARGEVDEHWRPAAAYYVATGGPVFLQRPAGAQTRQELEERRAQRREAPRKRARR